MTRIRFTIDPGLSDEEIADAIMTMAAKEKVAKIKALRSPNFEANVKIAKSYKNFVFGWANVSIRKDGTQIDDHQGHLIDVEDLEDAAYDFVLHSRSSGDMHITDNMGEMIESVIFTNEKMEKMGIPSGTIPEGWWVGFKLDPEHAELVRSGKRSMFSIEGTARLDPA